MRVIVPFAARNPKTRLSGTLSPEERAAFADAMVRDVSDAVAATGRDPELLTTEPLDAEFDAAADVLVDDRPLTEAVNSVLAAAEEPVAVVMADLALATPEALDRLFSASGDVVLAPGRGGGTNAVVTRHPGFRVDYHGVSYRDHRDVARAVGADVAVVDSFRLATDVDERADLAEVLLHADGRARDWLAAAGFRLAVTDGRVGVERE